jgi:hypothetical protein
MQWPLSIAECLTQAFIRRWIPIVPVNVLKTSRQLGKSIRIDAAVFLSAIAIGTGYFLDSLTHVFACPSYSFTQFLACRDRFSVLNLVTGLFAARTDFVTGSFELAT